MDDSAALAEVQDLAALHRILLTTHVRRERMPERGARYPDVRNALLTATAATWQDDRGTWKIKGGVDTDDDELTVVVAIQANVIVVTLF